MKCPTCPDVVLSMSSRNGVEIDFCPTCRGVWLDRGELDKIIEKSMLDQGPAGQPTTAMPANHQVHYDPYRKDAYKYKRKKSFLEEIFD